MILWIIRSCPFTLRYHSPQKRWIALTDGLHIVSIRKFLYFLIKRIFCRKFI